MRSLQEEAGGVEAETRAGREVSPAAVPGGAAASLALQAEQQDRALPTEPSSLLGRLCRPVPDGRPPGPGSLST